jgi:transposase
MTGQIGIDRGIRFRIYPTPAQDAELREWERQLRWLYNLATGQRLAALARPKGERPGDRAFALARDRLEQAEALAPEWVEWKLAERKAKAVKARASLGPEPRRADRADRAAELFEQAMALFWDARKERVDYYRQGPEMTAMLRELSGTPEGDQLERVVCSARQEVLRDVDKAWQRWRKKPGTGRPRFKNKTEVCRIHLSTAKHWKLEGSFLHLTGMAAPVGPLRMHREDRSVYGLQKRKLRPQHPSRPWPGDAKWNWGACNLRRRVNRWYAVFPLAYEIPLVHAPKRAVGINRGAVHAIADSDGRVVVSPAFFARALKQIRRCAFEIARRDPKKQRVQGSRRRERWKVKLALAHAKVADMRSHFLHEQSKYYATHYDRIAIEDMSVKEIVQSPEAEEQFHFSRTCKTAGCEKPVFKHRLCKSHHDAQKYIPKHLVHRNILDVGWYELGRQCEYKSAAKGGQVLAVDPGLEPVVNTVTGEIAEAGASSACAKCGNKLDKAYSGREYMLCTQCLAAGRERPELGDRNTSANILHRAMQANWTKPKTPSKKASIEIKGRERKPAA